MKTIHISFLFIWCRTNKFKGSFVFVYFWWLDCSKLLTIHTHERTILYLDTCLYRYVEMKVVFTISSCVFMCVGPRGGVFVEVGRQRGPDLKIKWNNTRIYWPKGKFLWRKTQGVRPRLQWDTQWHPRHFFVIVTCQECATFVCDANRCSYEDRTFCTNSSKTVFVILFLLSAIFLPR